MRKKKSKKGKEWEESEPACKEGGDAAKPGVLSHCVKKLQTLARGANTNAVDPAPAPRDPPRPTVQRSLTSSLLCSDPASLARFRSASLHPPGDAALKSEATPSQRHLAPPVPPETRVRSMTLCTPRQMLRKLEGSNGHCGWLEKWDVGEQKVSLWVPRFFIISHEGLKLFLDEEQRQPDGLPVPLTEVAAVSPSPPNGPEGLQITLKSLNFILLRFACLEEQIEWVFRFQLYTAYITLKSSLTGIHGIHEFPASFIRSKEVSFASDQTAGPAESAKLAKVVVVSEYEGRRDSMEDVNMVIEDLNEHMGLKGFPPQSVFGIFDGHSGIEAADYFKDHILELLTSHPGFRSELNAALEHAFETCDRNFLQLGSKSGTTAVLALMRGSTLVVANCGDCRAVMCVAGRAVDLTQDHRPEREDERARIEAAGGWITSSQEIDLPMLYKLGQEDIEDMEEAERLVGWRTIMRVNGCLQMTRSIGDLLIKDKKNDFFNQSFSGDLVISTPEIRTHTLAPEDEFLIIASDGLWDVVSSQEACDFVKKLLKMGKDPETICNWLVGEAYCCGSLDNVTVVIVFFK
mmetsp:Transcript_2112/g.4932  ORF Transcript_2112/g.4932 Transcript_2112/m.4932 type:complete len:576 (-) Transcript_2112:504-2231(-)|eukprot:CAMPEP_0177673150 /NCGR_PEP_ID=MMETSP0447-20121125/25770_1 /TAXON_ID=0 /ORGANISM="Stygamoeba regulata, Strain BSH-02190019" /LENGTH=575 /DNA_ID=CAMNT_0019180963 /DNA_START=474 /DNA_END=2201 /DNA_ORIENTATION=+